MFSRMETDVEPCKGNNPSVPQLQRIIRTNSLDAKPIITLCIEKSRDFQLHGRGHTRLQASDSTSTLQTNGMRNQYSRESLIPQKKAETWYLILIQVFGPFIIAGIGMVGAGLLLDQVKEWKVFKEIPEFLVLVTPLLGLKGNLEMTLASRLSTHANLGHMDTNHTKFHIAFGNLALTQVQAVVVGFLASVVAMCMGIISEGRFVFAHGLLLAATSILTAAIASCILGILMVSVILLSRKMNINPDNVATPVAASLGDLTTLFLLAWLGSILYEEVDDKPWLAPCIILGYIMFTPVWGWIAYINDYTRKVLKTGWPAVIIAMLISSGGGFLLDLASENYPKLALYQPVINGVGGNLVSVQASRISTSLHRDCEIGVLPEQGQGKNVSSVWMSPVNVFFKQGINSVAARVLLAIVIPGHLIFTTITHFMSASREPFSALFLIVYLTAALVQVVLLLYIAHIIINWFWKRKIDPDTSTIPYLTALGDLLGTGLLCVAFFTLSKVRT